MRALPIYPRECKGKKKKKKSHPLVDILEADSHFKFLNLNFRAERECGRISLSPMSLLLYANLSSVPRDPFTDPTGASQAVRTFTPAPPRPLHCPFSENRCSSKQNTHFNQALSRWRVFSRKAHRLHPRGFCSG